MVVPIPGVAHFWCRAVRLGPLSRARTWRRRIRVSGDVTRTRRSVPPESRAPGPDRGRVSARPARGKDSRPDKVCRDACTPSGRCIDRVARLTGAVFSDRREVPLHLFSVLRNTPRSEPCQCYLYLPKPAAIYSWVRGLSPDGDYIQGKDGNYDIATDRAEAHFSDEGLHFKTSVVVVQWFFIAPYHAARPRK